jgi:hypothetical protein
MKRVSRFMVMIVALLPFVSWVARAFGEDCQAEELVYVVDEIKARALDEKVLFGCLSKLIEKDRPK